MKRSAKLIRSLAPCLIATLLTAQPASNNMADNANPLLAESFLPYHYPPFDRIRDEHFKPAIEQGMRDELAEVEAIANDPEAATFENTIVGLERSGRLLQRAHRIFSSMNAVHTNALLDAVQKELSPRLAAHRDAVALNGALFGRIASLYEGRDKLGLDAPSKYLLERYYKDLCAPARSCPKQTSRNFGR